MKAVDQFHGSIAAGTQVHNASDAALNTEVSQPPQQDQDAVQRAQCPQRKDFELSADHNTAPVKRPFVTRHQRGSQPADRYNKRVEEIVQGDFFAAEVVSANWSRHLRLKNRGTKRGGPDFLACLVLSKIVYWGRPSKEGKRRYNGNHYQFNASQIASEIGCDRASVGDALGRLAAAGVIWKGAATVQSPSGKTLAGNVTLVGLLLEGLTRISQPPGNDSVRGEESFPCGLLSGSPVKLMESISGIPLGEQITKNKKRTEVALRSTSDSFFGKTDAGEPIIPEIAGVEDKGVNSAFPAMIWPEGTIEGEANSPGNQSDCGNDDTDRMYAETAETDDETEELNETLASLAALNGGHPISGNVVARVSELIQRRQLNRDVARAAVWALGARNKRLVIPVTGKELTYKPYLPLSAKRFVQQGELRNSLRAVLLYLSAALGSHTGGIDPNTLDEWSHSVRECLRRCYELSEVRFEDEIMPTLNASNYFALG